MPYKEYLSIIWPLEITTTSNLFLFQKCFGDLKLFHVLIPAIKLDKVHIYRKHLHIFFDLKKYELFSDNILIFLIFHIRAYIHLLENKLYFSLCT